MTESGIYRDKTIADKLMYIPNDDAQNYLFCRLNLTVETLKPLTKLTNQLKFTKILNVVKPTNKKTTQ